MPFAETTPKPCSLLYTGDEDFGSALTAIRTARLRLDRAGRLSPQDRFRRTGRRSSPSTPRQRPPRWGPRWVLKGRPAAGRQTQPLLATLPPARPVRSALR